MCSAQNSSDVWLCSCGYEFKGEEHQSHQTKKLRTGSMKRWTKVILIVASCFALLGYLVLSVNSPLNRPSAIRCILEWGRLAPFPESARQFSLSTTGSMFTREFQASFTAPATDIEQWLQQSPGTRDVIPDVSLPRFDGHPGRWVGVVSLVGSRSPQGIGSRGRCGAARGCRRFRCSQRRRRCRPPGSDRWRRWIRA